jgi:lysophospholipase L1-like esterase
MVEFLQKNIVFFILVIGFSTISFGQDDYRRAYLWEKEIAAFSDSDKKEFPNKKRVLFVGSSSIRGWRTLEKDFPEFYTINRGFGGSHLEDVNFYAPQIVFPYKPKLIVLYAGENDVVAGKSVASVFDDFKEFITAVRKNLPKTRLIVISVKPSPARQEYNRKFDELNDLLETETKKDKRLLFVDIRSAMLDAQKLPKKEIFQSDRLHLNAEGYRIWRDALAPHIRRGAKGYFKRPVLPPHLMRQQ